MSGHVGFASRQGFASVCCPLSSPCPTHVRDFLPSAPKPALRSACSCCAAEIATSCFSRPEVTLRSKLKMSMSLGETVRYLFDFAAHFPHGCPDLCLQLHSLLPPNVGSGSGHRGRSAPFLNARQDVGRGAAPAHLRCGCHPPWPCQISRARRRSSPRPPHLSRFADPLFEEVWQIPSGTGGSSAPSCSAAASGGRAAPPS